ncbi:hypothetical protein KO481_26505 [Nocardia sp. NEAU-G5]|uniref:Uncharacterized protein n=1 Tax=Nocardia albiluteola TaxID=2842303 RepID=A0ABS6B7B4_9NOCA|nr:hypothetical protein [Nocardia albiluteola]MBU3065069.1 hypothetical protein [Nocardia albiluteola]
MGTWDVGEVVLVAMAGGALLSTGFALLWSMGHSRPVLSADRGSLRRSSRDLGLWPPALSCSAPDHPLTLAEAHLAMQLHREHQCTRKRAAFTELVAAGHIKPDSSRPNETPGD